MHIHITSVIIYINSLYTTNSSVLYCTVLHVQVDDLLGAAKILSRSRPSGAVLQLTHLAAPPREANATAARR